MVHELVVARERDIKTCSKPTLNDAVLCQRTSKHWQWSGLSGDHYARLPSNNLSQTAFELWKPKENSGKTATIRSAACYPCQICGKHVRRELDCTPTLARINTDYNPGSVVSTAQSNQRDFSQSWPIAHHAGSLMVGRSPSVGRGSGRGHWTRVRIASLNG